MKDQYVIKLSDNHTTMSALEEIVNDVQAEVTEKKTLTGQMRMLMSYPQP